MTDYPLDRRHTYALIEPRTNTIVRVTELQRLRPEPAALPRPLR
jgi:hypothetical protein